MHKLASSSQAKRALNKGMLYLAFISHHLSFIWGIIVKSECGMYVCVANKKLVLLLQLILSLQISYITSNDAIMCKYQTAEVVDASDRDLREELSPHWSGTTEEHTKNLSGLTVTGTTSNKGTPRIRSKQCCHLNHEVQ
jgi:hypothetical protein